MKTNIRIFLAAGLMAMTASCTDLDVIPEAQFTEYPDSEAAVEAQMADVYFHLRGTLGRRYMESQALSSDEWVAQPLVNRRRSSTATTPQAARLTTTARVCTSSV